MHNGVRREAARRPPPRAYAQSVPHPLVDRAAALFKLGRYKEAENLLRLTLSTVPDDHVALHLLGVIAHAQGDYVQAIELLRKSVAISGGVASYHGNLGHAYLMSEQFAKAADCYRRPFVNPGSQLARFGLGMAHIGQRAFAAAATELAKVLEADPNHVDAHSNLGTAFSELGRHDEAISHFERALTLKPGNAIIHLKFGIALKNRGDFSSAYSNLARAAVLDPMLADARYQTGVVLHALDRLEEASRALEEALKLHPDMVPALYELGQVLNRLQELEEAAHCFERGIVLDPQSPILYQGLARTRHLQGRLQEARALVAQSLATMAQARIATLCSALFISPKAVSGEAIAAYRKAVSVRSTHGQAHLSSKVDHQTVGPTTPLRKSRLSSDMRGLGSLDAEQRATLELRAD